MSAVIKEEDEEPTRLEKDIQILQTVKQTKQGDLLAAEKEFHALAQAIMQLDMEKRKENNNKMLVNVTMSPDAARYHSSQNPDIPSPRIYWQNCTRARAKYTDIQL
jgi:hypothetical protein